MAKKRGNAARVLALVLAGLLVFSALASALYMIALGEEETPGRDSCAVRAEMLADEQALSCEQIAVCVNRTGEKLSQLFFSCYANALRRRETLPFDADDLAAAFPQGYAPGGLEILEVLVDGERADWGMQGEAEEFLRVAVDLEAGESAEITLRYLLLLPVCSGDMGAGLFDWRLANAFPASCVWRDGGYRLNSPLAAGEYAWNQAADWRLELTAPKEWILAASGGAVSREEEDGRRTWTARIDGARDMAVALSRRYTVWRQGKIAVYANDASAARFALETAGAALALFEEWFGEYPWAELDIAMSQYCLEAKSAPGLILLGRELFAHDARADMEFAIVRSTARQYFGCAAGNDPVNEPWLSEATATFAALLTYRVRYGEERFLLEMRERVLPSLALTVPGGVTPGSAATYFNTRAEYDLVVRLRGAAALYELWDAMGEERFLAAMRAYLEENRGAECGTREFVAALDSTGGSWGALLADLLATIAESGAQAGRYER